MKKPPDLKVVPGLVGALIMGMVSFAGFAAYLAATQGGMAKGVGNEPVLLAAVAIMGPMEFIAYRAAVRPALLRKARETAAAGNAEMLEAQFVTGTILVAALAEGWGLFGCVIVLLFGQWAALAAPLIAAGILASLLDPQGRFERFKQEAAGPA